MYRLHYDVNLNVIDGSGDFPCPRCGITISPEDESEETYSIVETSFNNGNLLEIVILCNSCGSSLSLHGFEKIEYE